MSEELVAGYIAHQILRGVYARPPPRRASLSEDVARVKRLATEVAQQASGLQPVRREVRGVEVSIRGLKVHSRSLEAMADAATLEAARQAMSHLRARARDFQDSNPGQEDRSGLPGNFGYEDALVLVTARWFKHEYFRWVDPIKCLQCGENMQCQGGVEPNAEERAGGAGRCELWVCGDHPSVRFPRLNAVGALMKSRVGRCGEFAQLFYVFLLALGLEARYVWNSEDHVWTEYWSPSLQHWVHVDSCEAEVGKPQLYDRGWGKQQAYCLAFGRLGAEDVTSAYVDDWDACLARRLDKTWSGPGVQEQRLRWLLLQQTVLLRRRLDQRTRDMADEMDEGQARWMNDEAGRWREAEAVNLKGRDSGTQEWKEERGEVGDQPGGLPVECSTGSDTSAAAATQSQGGPASSNVPEASPRDVAVPPLPPAALAAEGIRYIPPPPPGHINQPVAAQPPDKPANPGARRKSVAQLCEGFKPPPKPQPQRPRTLNELRAAGLDHPSHGSKYLLQHNANGYLQWAPPKPVVSISPDLTLEQRLAGAQNSLKAVYAHMPLEIAELLDRHEEWMAYVVATKDSVESLKKCIAKYLSAVEPVRRTACEGPKSPDAELLPERLAQAEARGVSDWAVEVLKEDFIAALKEATIALGRKVDGWQSKEERSRLQRQRDREDPGGSFGRFRMPRTRLCDGLKKATCVGFDPGQNGVVKFVPAKCLIKFEDDKPLWAPPAPPPPEPVGGMLFPERERVLMRDFYADLRAHMPSEAAALIEHARDPAVIKLLRETLGGPNSDNPLPFYFQPSLAEYLDAERARQSKPVEHDALDGDQNVGTDGPALRVRREAETALELRAFQSYLQDNLRGQFLKVLVDAAVQAGWRPKNNSWTSRSAALEAYMLRAKVRGEVDAKRQILARNANGEFCFVPPVAPCLADDDELALTQSFERSAGHYAVLRMRIPAEVDEIMLRQDDRDALRCLGARHRCAKVTGLSPVTVGTFQDGQDGDRPKDVPLNTTGSPAIQASRTMAQSVLVSLETGIVESADTVAPANLVAPQGVRRLVREACEFDLWCFFRARLKTGMRRAGRLLPSDELDADLDGAGIGYATELKGTSNAEATSKSEGKRPARNTYAFDAQEGGADWTCEEDTLLDERDRSVNLEVSETPHTAPFVALSEDAMSRIHAQMRGEITDTASIDCDLGPDPIGDCTQPCEEALANHERDVQLARDLGDDAWAARTLNAVSRRLEEIADESSSDIVMVNPADADESDWEML